MQYTQHPINVVNGLRFLHAAQLCAENGEYGGAVKSCRIARRWFEQAVLETAREKYPPAPISTPLSIPTTGEAP